jgi:hypothetical protein
MSEPGICKYCRITDDQVDGCRISWIDMMRTCCNRSACVRARNEELRRQRAARPRPHTPADIHQLKKQEAAAKRKRYRDAAMKRGLLREAVTVVENPTPQQLEEFHTQGTDARTPLFAGLDAAEERKTA